jgi:hypothetical protein
VSGGWRVAGVSVTGPEHLRRGVGSRDAFEHRVTPDGFVLAVADGARSAVGAWLAVQIACDAAEEARGGAQPYADAVLGTLGRRLSALTGGEPAAYGTMLLALVARPPRFAYLSVGGCFLVVEHRGGGAHLVVPPGHGDTVRTGLIDDAGITGVALCTDGLVDGMLGAGRAADGSQLLLAPADFTGYLRAFAAPGNGPPDLRRRFESDAFAATSADDKTIVLAARP